MKLLRREAAVTNDRFTSVKLTIKAEMTQQKEHDHADRTWLLNALFGQSAG